MNSNTIILEDFNTPLTSMNRSSRQKSNKKTLALNDTLGQIDLIDIYKIFHSKAAEYTLFSVHVKYSPFCRNDCHLPNGQGGPQSIIFRKAKTGSL